MPKIEIEQDLCFALLDVTRLAHVWALRNTKYENEITPGEGPDDGGFKSWKWSDEGAREHAQAASACHRQLLNEMEGQVQVDPNFGSRRPT